jgi:hypothetical protein
VSADARDRTWRFANGNEAAVRHGIWSRRRVDPVVTEFVEGVLARRPDLANWPEALFAWARAEARALLLSEYLLDHDAGSDEAMRVLRYEGQFQRLASELQGRLGLDAQSEAALTRERAEASRSVVDLDGIRARGRQVIDARPS